MFAPHLPPWTLVISSSHPAHLLTSSPPHLLTSSPPHRLTFSKAYADLQRTWKKSSGLSPAETAAIQARALAVPVGVVERCTRLALAVEAFVPRCKKSIRSDAVVAVHLLAGAARAAFQTVLVNSPPAEEAARLAGLISQVSAKELAYVQVGGELKGQEVDGGEGGEGGEGGGKDVGAVLTLMSVGVLAGVSVGLALGFSMWAAKRK